MRVLMVCDSYYPIYSASANCIQAIIKYLNSRGFNCDVLNITDNFELPEELKLDECKIYSFNNVCKMGIKTQNFRLLSIPTKIYILINKFKYKLMHYPIRKNLCKVIQKKIKQVGSQYDVIIPVVSNFNVGYAVMQYCSQSKKPYILYQVDPIATNQVFEKYYKRLNLFEKKLYSRAFAVVTTPILANEKSVDTAYKGRNIVEAEFPNVRDLTKNLREADTRSISICSFCGYIYSGVRDCSYTLRLFSAIKGDAVRIRFAGAGQEGLIEEYSKGLLKGKLEHVGKLSQEESALFMQSSDFLINIGNTMVNQVPSKLFDYISTGLPIINVCKNKDCPTIPYLERYGLAINLLETEDETILAEQAVLLSEFIQKNKGKRRSYAEIKALFQNNTADYVGKQFALLLDKCRCDI